MSDSKFYHFQDSGLFYGLSSPVEATVALKEGGFAWLNYYNPEREEINQLVDLIGIHPLSVEDCFDEKQVPKIEHFQTNTFIIFNAFRYSESTLLTDEVNIFIGRNFLVTVSGHNSEGRRPLKNIEDVIEKDSPSLRTGPAYLLHRVLDYLVDQKYDAFDTMEDELEWAEESLLEDVSSFQPVNLISLRKSLMALRKGLFHESEILVKINRQDCPFIPEKALIPYRDIYDHLVKFFELTETYRETETSLMELYTSLLNNQMTRMSNETNTSVRRLTMIATVFMPLTLIASIGGMSEWTMITGQENWKVSYPFFILGMIVIGGLNYLFIRGMERGVFRLKAKKKK